MTFYYEDYIDKKEECSYKYMSHTLSCCCKEIDPKLYRQL